MSTTILHGVEAAAIRGSDGNVRYLMLEQSCESNSIPQIARWRAVFFGTGPECLRDAATRSFGIPLSAGYIEWWMRAMESPVALNPPRAIQIKIGKNHDHVTKWKADDIASVFIKHRLDVVCESDRLTCGVTSATQYADLLAEIQAMNVPIWKLLPDTLDLEKIVDGERQEPGSELAYVSPNDPAIQDITVFEIPASPSSVSAETAAALSAPPLNSRIQIPYSIGPAYIYSIPSLGIDNAYAPDMASAIDRMIMRLVEAHLAVDYVRSVRAIDRAVRESPEIDRSQKVFLARPEMLDSILDHAYNAIRDRVGADEHILVGETPIHVTYAPMGLQMGGPQLRGFPRHPAAYAGFETTVGALIDAGLTNHLRLLQSWQIHFLHRAPVQQHGIAERAQDPSASPGFGQ